jgi:plasmid stabilization system protein ParE
VEYYQERVPDLGGELVEEVERAVEEIASFPEIGSPYLADTRRVLVRRFPYSVVYQVRPDGIVILAVAHQKRKPGYWWGRSASRL